MQNYNQDKNSKDDDFFDLNESSKTWEELAKEKIEARERLNNLPPEIAQEEANVLHAELWQPDFQNHKPPGSFWDFDEDE